MSSVSLADSNSCPLNHQYHYIQYPGYYEHITQQQHQHQQQQQQQHHHHHHLQQQQHQHQHQHQHQQNAQPQAALSTAYTYCNCPCSCSSAGGASGRGGGGGGGGNVRTTPDNNSCHHAPQSSVDSQMAVAVIVHRGGSGSGGDGSAGGGGGGGGGSGGSISNKQSQSEQSLLNHSYQALQQLTSASGGGGGGGEEQKPLNVLGNSKLNISCDCDLECTCAAAANKAVAVATAAAAAAAAAAAQKRGALHDAMLAADEITVSESDNNSTMKKRGRGSNTRSSSKKFNSWCVHNDIVGTPLPEKRCADAHYHASHMDIYCDGDEGDGLDVCLKSAPDTPTDTAATDSSDHRPPLPPRPPPRPRTQTINSNGHRHGGGSGTGIKKYVIWCLICGGFSCLLGVLFLGVYFLLHSYTITVGNFETVPTFVPATLLILTGLCIMSLARRRNRYSYLIKLSGACGLISALTCALVTVTTTVLHMSRLQALRECEYAQKTRTCTCYSNMIDSQVDHVDKEGVRLVFDSLSDCGVVHGSLYSCLRAIFGLSVAGVLIAVFSCMLVYQLLSHERKKMYWEQLELRCRSLYTSQQGPPPNIAAVAAGARGVCRCCEQCHAHRQSGVAYPWDDGAGEPPRFWTGQPPGNFYSPNPCADELHMSGVGGGGGGSGGVGVGGSGGNCRGSHRGMPHGSNNNNARTRGTTGWSWPRSWPWQRNSPNAGSGNSSTRFRQTPSSPDSQYGFSNSMTVDGVHTVVSEESVMTAAPTHALQQPFSVMPPSALPYGVWGPPPPYSDPNSPARRGYYQYVQPSNVCGASNNLNAPQGERPLMTVDHHHHQQAAQVTQSQVPQPQHMPCLNHRSAFLDQQTNATSCCAQPSSGRNTIKRLAGGGGVGGGGGGGNGTDDSGGKKEGEYENTHSDSDGGMRDRFSNTLPSRKIKKRVEAGVKSIGPNSHGVERVNVQQVFANGNHTNTSDMDAEDSNAELVSKLSMRHKRNNNASNTSSSSSTNNNSNNNNNNSNKHNCNAGSGCGGGVESAVTLAKDTVGDPAESEVYFADVSSCCNISVKNDNYYDDPNQSSLHQSLHHCHSNHNHSHGQHGQQQQQQQLRAVGSVTTAHHQHQSSTCSHNSVGSNNSSSNEDYLAQRFSQRENSIRSRLPFPQARSDDDDYERNQSSTGATVAGNSSSIVGMPKDISHQSMCSLESETKTEFTDLSPATPCSNKFAQLHFANASVSPANATNGKLTNHVVGAGASPTNFVASFPPYSSEQQSLEAHRRSTKNIHELLIPTDTPHYEIINDQFPMTPTVSLPAALPVRGHQKSSQLRHSKRSNELTPHKVKLKSQSREHLAADPVENSVNGGAPSPSMWSENVGNVIGGSGGGGSDRMRL